jgi:hypothetical protein
MPVMECRSVSIDGAICGTLNPEDGLYYTVMEVLDKSLLQTQTTTWSINEETGACEVSGPECTGSCTNEYVGGFNQNDNPIGGWDEVLSCGCVETITCEGSSWSGSGSYHYNDHGFNLSGTFDCETQEWTGDNGGYSCSEPSGGTCYQDSGEETTYSGLATLEEPEFPAFALWPGETGDAPPALLPGQTRGTECSASSNGNATSISKRKVEMRFKHAPSATCYLKVWLRKTTTIYANPSATPPIAGSVTHDDSEVYEWNPTANPCIAVPTKSVEHADNVIKSTPVISIAAPAVLDTTTTVSYSMLKYACIPGYEPDLEDPTKPNGYPCPDCEADPP